MIDKTDLRSALQDYGLKAGVGAYAKGQERIHHILEEAIVLIDEEGLKEFSMRELARRAGLRLANLQYYFKTRSDVVLAIARFYEQAYVYETKRIFDDPKASLREKLGAFIDMRFESSGRSGLSFSLQSEIRTASLDAAEPVYRAYEYVLQRIVGALREAHPALSPESASRRAAMLLAALEGTEFLFDKDDARSVAPTGLKDEYTSVLLDAVLSAERDSSAREPYVGLKEDDPAG